MSTEPAETTEPAENADASPEALRVAFVPGAMPEKWFRRYRDRTGLALTSFTADDPVLEIEAGRADMALARDPRADRDLHRVRLYEEAPGVAVDRDHVLSLVKDGDVVARADIAGETVLLDASRAADPGAVREMLQVVATGAGIVVAPRPLLRALNARGVVHRELEPEPEPGAADGADDAVPATTLWLTWPKDADDDRAQELAGIVRGRREGSRRSALSGGAVASGAPAKEEPRKKKMSAREKTLAKQARREAAGKKAGGGRGKGGPRKPGKRR